jgi:hypothetical protein
MAQSDETSDDSGADIEQFYSNLGISEPGAAQYFEGLRALTSTAETIPDFVLSYNSFPIETK